MKTKIVIGLMLFTVTFAFAQQPNLPHKPMTKEDSAAINALAMYPDTVRLNIFEACMYPAAIVNIGTLQKNTSSQFSNLVGSYNKDEQEDLYNLSRYPGLIANLVQGGRKSDDQLNGILMNYPNEIRATAISYAKGNFETLQRIDNLQAQTNAQFEQIIYDLPPRTQDAFRDLIQLPEIISILNDHLELAVRVGDRYRRDPQHVIYKMDSANIAETQQHAQEVAEWKQFVKDNPDAAKDLKSAGDEYAQENGYSQDEINTVPSADYVDNYTCYPYSYWFGYPAWYPYSYWYPYPFWFDCGYYYDAFGNMVVIGMPSYYFTNWYFYYPEHWHRYPHLGDHYINHYYGHRDSHTGNSYVVHRWVDDNRNYLPQDFVQNKSKRAETIRQVGQMHVDAEKKIGGRNVSPEQRNEYFQKNVSKYPELNKTQAPSKSAEKKETNHDYYKEQPTKQPPVKINKQEATPVAPKPAPTPSKQNYNFNNINKATDYHKSNWNNVQPAPRSQPAPQPAPQPSRQAPPSGGGRRK